MKLKVFGVGNEKDYTFVIFSKGQDFFKSFEDLTEKAFGHVCYSHEVEKIAEAGKRKVKKVSDYADRHETCTERGVTFDLFFGAKKVFVIIHAPKKQRDRFMSALGKSVSWAR